MEDARAAAVILAAVADEGFLGNQPPVDLERRQRFEELAAVAAAAASACARGALIEREVLWVPDDEYWVVGYPGAQASVPGVLSIGDPAAGP